MKHTFYCSAYSQNLKDLKHTVQKNSIQCTPLKFITFGMQTVECTLRQLCSHSSF